MHGPCLNPSQATNWARPSHPRTISRNLTQPSPRQRKLGSRSGAGCWPPRATSTQPLPVADHQSATPTCTPVPGRQIGRPGTEIITVINIRKSITRSYSQKGAVPDDRSQQAPTGNLSDAWRPRSRLQLTGVGQCASGLLRRDSHSDPRPSWSARLKGHSTADKSPGC